MEWEVRAASYVGDFRVELEFNDGLRGIVDLEGELYGEVFEVLKDVNEFKKVRFDPELRTIVWPNGADMAPEFLYDILRDTLDLEKARLRNADDSGMPYEEFRKTLDL
jgi:hypothetical protein